MSRYRPRFGLSVIYEPDETPGAYVERLHRFGFTAAELRPDYIERHAGEIHVLNDELDYLTCHLPCRGDLKTLTEDPADDARILERLKRPFELAAAAGCRTFTYHVTNIVGQRLDEYWQRSVEMARKLGELARGFDSIVGVENCYPVVRSGYFARKFLDEVNDPDLGMTLDTGHFWSAMCEDELGRHSEHDLMRTPAGDRIMNEMCCAMARAVREKVFNIHIHNIHAGDWKDHRPVDQGVMQYEPFFAILREIGYDKTVIVEHRSGPAGGWEDFESSASYLQRFMPDEARS